jgi:hypothetical protein
MARPKTTKSAQLPAFRSDAEDMRPIRVDVSRKFLARVKARKRRGTARTR